MTARGERLNNPGDIRITSQTWLGKVVPSQDAEFETFSAPEYGIRALAKILLSYHRQGINTIHAIISKYAPSSENDTQAYEADVAKRLNVKSTDPVNVNEYPVMYNLVRAIICQETGECVYNDDTINKGLQLAGIELSPPTA